MDFYIELSEEQFDKVKNLDSSLGMWLWNMAVMLAPYDTGNLRRSITLVSNTSKQINVRYNTMQANYIKFLEEGLGPVKKYKGFIEDKTRIAMVESLIEYLKTGENPQYTNAPFVVLRGSSSVFPKERPFLRMADMKANVINANVRRKISQIRELSYRKSIGEDFSQFRGKKAITQNINKSIAKRMDIAGSRNYIKASSTGISTLNQMYNELRKG